jgi:hypothetical protein
VDVRHNAARVTSRYPVPRGGEQRIVDRHVLGCLRRAWEIVENAAIALTDGVDLILKPGRNCQNGKPVPINQPDFQRFARAMRAARQVGLQAARTRNQEKVSDFTNNIADACSSYHEVYRDKGPADSPARCTPPAKR